MVGGGEPRKGFVPALGLDLPASWYDPLVAWTTREDLFKRRLLEQARIAGGAAVLDLGCGTGTLALRLLERHPTASVTGLDADARMLDRARRKAAAAGLAVRLDRGTAERLPYAPATFDRVLSSLFFHHLTGPQKHRAAAEAFRVLRPGGELHVADWGAPGDPLMRALFLAVRLADGFATTADHVAGRLPRIFEQAGFAAVRVEGGLRTALGSLALIRAVKPPAGR